MKERLSEEELKKVLGLSVSLPISITWTDFPTKEDCAVIVYFTGCSHGCPGCQNKELQNKESGELFRCRELLSMIKEEATKAHTNKVVLSGGDPLFQFTQDFSILLSDLHESGFEICVYTGYNIDFALNLGDGFVDYYKCGRYLEDQKEKEWGKDSDKMVFATKNQRLYDKNGKLISVGNVYYFKKIDRIIAKIKNFFRKR